MRYNFQCARHDSLLRQLGCYDFVVSPTVCCSHARKYDPDIKKPSGWTTKINRCCRQAQRLRRMLGRPKPVPGWVGPESPAQITWFGFCRGCCCGSARIEARVTSIITDKHCSHFE